MKTGAAKSEKSLKASFVQLDPSAVTYEDVIGSIDVATKKKTGLELVNMVYPKYGYVPSLLLAPGWSHVPAVALALDAKATSISSLFTGKVVMDVDSAEGKADSIDKVKEFKDNNAISSRGEIAMCRWQRLATINCTIQHDGGKFTVFSRK